MKLIIEEATMTLRVKLSETDINQIVEGATVIKVRKLTDSEVGVCSLNIEVCKGN